MTNQPPKDSLVALWQTAPAPNAHTVANDVERLNRLHRRSDRSILAILWCIAILLVFEEATGRLASHGLLSIIWTLALVIGLVARRHAQCARLDALTADTVSLLRRMLAQARRDLFLARCLYAGVPLGALVGYLAMKLLDHNKPAGAVAVASNLQAIQTAAGVVVLLVMMATGALLSRSRALQVKDLTDKLKSLEDDL